uniref:Uncharacterized protein n=1 Tax=viral metagenome TaxID=1070528 RepID=A0A6M3JIF1_9ZZZZ
MMDRLSDKIRELNNKDTARVAENNILSQVKKRLIEIDCRLSSRERDSGIAEFIDELEKIS